jgi:hypothetical protein
MYMNHFAARLATAAGMGVLVAIAMTTSGAAQGPAGPPDAVFSGATLL